MKKYIIMSKNNKIATICDNGECVLHDIENGALMPYNLYLEDAKEPDIDTRINNLAIFYHWCASRILTLDRKYYKEIMNSLGKMQVITDFDRAQISISYHALSLTDVFWVKTDEENISFDYINLYNHSLSDAFIDVSLRGKQLTVENLELINNNDIAGDVSTLGVSPKAWIKENGIFYLLKDGDKNEVKAELLASKIIDCFKIDHVQYFESEWNAELVSKSKIVTSIDIGIVPMEYVNIFAVNNNDNIYDIAIRKDKHNYYMMNIIDYLIGNNDRHMGNWGFLVYNDTNDLVKLYPLMDFNKAFSEYDKIDGTLSLTSKIRKSQKDAAIEAVKIIGLNQISEVKKEWFDDENIWNMFNKRLNILKENL